MKSRVLFVDHTGALGGAELVLLDIAEAYRDTSTVLLLSDGPFRQRLTERGVNVQVLPGGDALHAVRREASTVSWRATYAACRVAMKMVPLARQHDCLHANTQKAFAIACLAGAMARRPVIWDLNDLLAPEHFSPLHIKLDVLLANHCARLVLANSKASADALVRQGGAARKLHVVHNGISPAPFDAVTDADVIAARAELGIADAPAIGLFGRLAHWKGQHVALEAMRELPDVHLVIVGDALFGESEYVAFLHDKVRELNLADRVQFLGFRRDIPRLMRAVDIVAHTSTAPEPFGRVIVEGMLARRAVVATSGGGVDEIIVPGVTGELIKADDPGLLARTVRALFAEPGRRLTMARAGRRAAIERFSIAAMIDSMSAHIEGIICQ